MAQALAAQIFAESGLVCEVSSAGVSAWGNQPASRHACTVMIECGLSLVSHKAAMVSQEILDGATVVLTMTRTHQAMLLSDYPGAKEKVFLLSEYVGEAADIADPFGGSVDEYRACAEQIKQLLRRVADKLRGL